MISLQPNTLLAPRKQSETEGVQNCGNISIIWGIIIVEVGGFVDVIFDGFYFYGIYVLIIFINIYMFVCDYVQIYDVKLSVIN